MSLSITGRKLARPLINTIQTRQYYYKFTRRFTPPLQEKRESPYIVGPYLKPDYTHAEERYITEPIKNLDVNDFDHHIYIPERVDPDETRTVQLLLIEDVEGLGIAGQVVDAPYRYGASKLVAMKKAEYATDFAKKWYQFGEKTYQSASSALSPRTARLLRADIYRLPVKKEVNVEPWHISLALRMADFKCPTEAIEKDSINYVTENEQDLMKCIVRINNHERVEVKFYFDPLVKEE